MRYLLLNILIITSYVVNAQNCEKKFAEGEYYYPDIQTSSVTLRNQNMQTSIYENGMQIIWKLTWSSRCSYKMELVEIVNGDGIFSVGDQIKVNITSVEGKCYTFNSTLYSKKYPEGKEFPPGKMCKK